MANGVKENPTASGGYMKYPIEGAPVDKYGRRGPLADGRKTSGPTIGKERKNA
jgi:hypothetical protein